MPGSRRDGAARLLVALSIAVAAPAALVTAGFAAVAGTGCYVECGGADRTAGLLLAALAAGLLTLPGLLAWRLYRRRAAVVRTVGTQLLVLLALAAVAALTYLG